MTMDYWLYVHPYVYVSSIKDRTILYNTIDGKLLEYDNRNMGKIARLIKRLNSDSNLYVIGITEKDIDEDVRQFIEDLRKYYLGDIIDKRHRPHRPIQLKPLLSLQRTFDYLTTGQGQSKILTRDELPNYLNVITLHINDVCGESCSFCCKAYKQFVCCDRGQRGEISVELLKKLLEQTRNSRLYKLNITGGNIFRHSCFREIVNILDGVEHKKEYYIHYKNIEDFQFLNGENNRLFIIVHFPVDVNELNRSLEILKRLGIEKKFRFIVQEMDDIQKAYDMIASLKVKEAELIPYFNGGNWDFFNQKVFLDKDSIIQARPGMKSILARMTINTWDFKKLTVFGNGDVFANLNYPAIGNLNRDHIFDLVERELNHGKSWTKARRHVKPCKSCVFNALCPPISNYEYTLRRYNLCNIDLS